MQIYSNSHTHQRPIQENFSTKQEVYNTQKINPKKISSEIQKEIDHKENERQTYGLLVLELMSDSEYKAFQRATAGMNESEKMIAAQSLYSLTSFYNGKIQEKNQGFYNTIKNSDFINKYKNAFASQNKIDLNT